MFKQADLRLKLDTAYVEKGMRGVLELMAEAGTLDRCTRHHETKKILTLVQSDLEHRYPQVEPWR